METIRRKMVGVGARAACCALTLVAVRASFAAAPKPGAVYVWHKQAGDITVRMETHLFGLALLQGTIQNSTSVQIVRAVLNYRQYQRPDSGVIWDSPIAIVGSIPPGQSARFEPIAAKIADGCALVLDSVDVVAIDASGSQGVEKLVATNAEPFWYAGPGCASEERKYRKAHRSR